MDATPIRPLRRGLAETVRTLRSAASRTTAPVIVATLAGLAAPASADPLAVVAHAPTANAVAATTSPLIEIILDQPVDPATVTPSSVRILGRTSGVIPGDLGVSADGTTIRFHPSRPFAVGDRVLVQVSRAVTAADGDPLRSEGYAFQFRTPVRGGVIDFTRVQDIAMSEDDEYARPRGGVAIDLDADGFPDIAAANSSSDDLRVFPNAADGTPQVDPWLEPTVVSSGLWTAHAADLNGDGHADLVTTSDDGRRLGILHGDGSGGLAVVQTSILRGKPLHTAIFDVDGDGDDDVIIALTQEPALERWENQGDGTFLQGDPIELIADSEGSIDVADMNGDGRLDLVVGTETARLIVMVADGDGTFSVTNFPPCGGPSRQLALGDLDGDGDADVISVSGKTGTMSVLLGNGAGALSAAVTTEIEFGPLWVDVGDLDHDGDLDAAIANILGDLLVLENDGAGTFSVGTALDARDSVNVAMLVDLDVDGDLDVVSLDRADDRLLVDRNDDLPPVADLDGDGETGFGDLVLLLADWGPCLGCPADLDGSGTVDFGDLLILLAGFGLDT